MLQTAEAPAVWRPHPGQQTAFLSSPADEVFFGGAAGPGKSTCLLMESLRQVDNPLYRAILFRRLFPELEAADGLIDRSTQWFPALGGRYNDQKHVWKFPSGARIYFGHMQHDDDYLLYQGPQFAFIGFDELTEFTERQYTHMFSRNRAPEGSGLRVYMRAASNPGNVGHHWVKERFVVRDIINRLRYFAIIEGRDQEIRWDHPDARSRAFYPGRLTDNPSIGQGYVRNLNAMSDEVAKARLLYGDWDIEYTEGRIYGTWSTGNIDADRAVYNPDLPIYWGVDDGYTFGHGPGHADYHPRVILFIQNNALGGLSVIDELCVTGETYGETFEKALAEERFPYRRPNLTWIDGSAATFRAEFDARGLSTANGTHEVVEGVKAVRELVLGADGVRRLLVNPRCENLIYEMALYRSDARARSKTGEPVPMKLNDHSADALRYVVYHQ